MYRIVTAAALLLAITLVACGGNDSEKNPSAQEAALEKQNANVLISKDELAPPFKLPGSCVGSSYKKVMTFIPPETEDEKIAYQTGDVVQYMKYVREIRNIKFAVAGLELLPQINNPSAWLTVIQKSP